MSSPVDRLLDEECPLHPVRNEVCGGPHRKVLTELGEEVLAPGEEPIGTPKPTNAP